MQKLNAILAIAIAAWSVTVASAEPAAQCSRNADDIKSAVVIQNDNGEFCAADDTAQKAIRDDIAAYYAKFNAPPVQPIDESGPAGASGAQGYAPASGGDPRAMMMAVVARECAGLGAGSDMCTQMASGMIDAALAEYQAKCAAEGISSAQCDAAIMQEIASKQL
jgi:hypothetical protein